MISLPEYKVMGEDGHEYGPVAAEQICQWIAEERLERKSPVKTPDTRDWVFLGSLPEFADAFQSVVPPPKQQRRIWPLAVTMVIFFAAALIFWILKTFTHP